jgi:2,3,4,5-tetrahydropyridine-2,6-dicarboxylate N-succinyltransferase
MNIFEQNLANAQTRLGIQEGGPNVLQPVAFGFSSGFENAAGESKGSLTILWNAAMLNLTVGDTLPLFGNYLDEVIGDENGSNHPNIRELMKYGRHVYVGSIITFHGNPVRLKPTSIENIINAAWENRANISIDTVSPEVKDAVEHTLFQLNDGSVRVATRVSVGKWTVHEWVKKAVLLSFRLKDNVLINSGDLSFFDKVPLKFAGLTPDELKATGVRIVPPAIARRGSYIAKGAILMPSFVNIGAYVDEGTMVDAWATVGSCAQIGKHVHLSGGVGIGGVLEPMQAGPTIIEDNCFIGARSEVVEGVVVEENSVLGMGVYIGQSTPIYDRSDNSVSYGRIPSGSVVVSGTLPKDNGRYSLYAAVIVKRVDAQTRSKTSINDLLRD